MRNSDVAMYRAKESGKNGFQYFSPDMDAHGRERQVWPFEDYHLVRPERVEGIESDLFAGVTP